MKKILIAPMVVLAMATVSPARAADLGAAEAQQAGAFGGLRVRLPLGRSRMRGVRAGLTIAPTLRSRGFHGEPRNRIGEGLELSITDREPLTLSLAGTPVSRLAQGQAELGGQRMGVSTLGWVAIGVGVVVVSLFTLAQLCADGEVCGSE